MSQKARKTRIIEVIIHLVTWSYIFLMPFIFTHSHENGEGDWERVLGRTLFSLCLFITFYVNYFWLIPRYFLMQRSRWFVTLNVLLLIFLSIFFELGLNTHFLGCFGEHRHTKGQSTIIPVPEVREQGIRLAFRLAFFLRSVLSFSFAWGASMAVRLSVGWHEAERARSEAELDRTAAELINLKSQISPHFLLNTLNNIYALTAFETSKAQSAILQLSRMLRYQLYEELGQRVSLVKEADFLLNYVALMRLRLTDRVDVQTEIDPQAFHGLSVAPHIFIPLVENAFKHGISPTQPSLIHLRLTCADHVLTFYCRNSNFPKSANDKSPGGIGLRQVARWLQLAYPDAYSWEHGPTADGAFYETRIVLRADDDFVTAGKNKLLPS